MLGDNLVVVNIMHRIPSCEQTSVHFLTTRDKIVYSGAVCGRPYSRIVQPGRHPLQ
jgi:hypothetical protein